ncbi:MAG: cupin domain-containing protein [Chloroflexi bacterium]|nr:cupin domain-containing protein [Chloroflexota bacterium]
MRAKFEDLPVVEDTPEFVSRQAEWGDMNIALEKVQAGMDATELFKSLPGGRCQVPHWGYLLKGRARIKYADREEIIQGGDAYYMAPGHIPIIEEESEFVEFSPKGEYQKTMEALAKLEEKQRGT